MSTDLVRHALNGATMGTRWSALFYADTAVDVAPVHSALQQAVEAVDTQMSTWKPDSDLMRLNAAPVGDWVTVPAQMIAVLALGLQIGQASDGAFEIGMGDAVTAWGFGAAEATSERIQTAMQNARVPAAQALSLDVAQGRVRKAAPIAIDLNGIAKGYGVDCLAQTLARFGIHSALVGIDGEMRATGLRPDGEPWTVAVEVPEYDRRAAHSVIALHDGAVATSGDYRHWVDVQGRRLSHTMDPQRGAPLIRSAASVTVVAPTCAEADAWATALMVLGPEKGASVARAQGLNVLFLERDGGQVHTAAAGPLFSESEADHVG